MRVSKVRIGEKFVLDDRGGVWERTGANDEGVVARCSFGPRDVFGKEFTIDPLAYCYIIFEESKPFGEYASQNIPDSDVNPTIRVVDEESDTCIHEIVNPTSSQIACLSSAETLRFTPPGKRRHRLYSVSEFAFDLDANEFYLLVLSGTMGGRDEDDNRPS
jgi:hypothetical protein